MPKPIRRSDRQNRDFLRRFFASQKGQEVLRGQQVEADTPFPGVQLLPEAEVYGEPTQYEEADLGKAALLALREGAGMAPIIGEALDVAEFENIRRTGKDFYGDEADPTMYAGLTAAGMLLPNIIERPARAIGRGAKKFFKFGKKADTKYAPEFNEVLVSERILDDLSKNKSVSTNVETPVRRDGIDILPESTLSPYNFSAAPRTNRNTQYGVEFNRRFYSDPEIQAHLREEYFPGGYDVSKAGEVADRLAIMDEARSKAQNAVWKLGIKPGSDKAYQEAYHSRVAEELKGTGISLDDFKSAFGPTSYFGHTGPQFSKMPEGTELEFLFRRGQRTPDMRMDDDMLETKGYAGVYQYNSDNIYGTTDFMDQSKQKSLGAHEANHWSNFRHFFGEGTSSKIIPKSYRTIADNYRDAAQEATKKSSHDFISGRNHWANIPKDNYSEWRNALYSDPPEILARTQELRLAMADALQGRSYINLTDKQKKDVLNGDLSSIGGEDGLQKLISRAGQNTSYDSALPDPEFWDILKGQGSIGSFDKERLKSIQKLLKAGFVFTGAAGAYGAMDNQGQAPTGMARGGVIYMKKKPTGMSVIRK